MIDTVEFNVIIYVYITKVAYCNKYKQQTQTCSCIYILFCRTFMYQVTEINVLSIVYCLLSIVYCLLAPTAQVECHMRVGPRTWPLQQTRGTYSIGHSPHMVPLLDISRADGRDLGDWPVHTSKPPIIQSCLPAVQPLDLPLEKSCECTKESPEKPKCPWILLKSMEPQKT